MATTQAVRIQIAKDKHGEWTIEPKDVEGNGNRFEKQFKERFDERWAERNGKKRDHKPIIFLEGDVLRFECAVEFEIGAKKNPDVAEVLAAPDNPFGWSKVQSGKAGSSIDGTVLKGKGVKLQAFYKFYGWVIVDGQRIPVDPDGYCGG
jgi:hypothetical protein